jgi:hypothetical protein
MTGARLALLSSLGLGLWLAIACKPDPATKHAFCSISKDCPAGQLCLADLTSSVSYCTVTCGSDKDCPDFQSCQSGTDVADFSANTTALCVDKVRMCLDHELCNGLDDDCDGVIDNPPCQIVKNCLDDVACGGWVCSAPANQPTTICVPPNDMAPVPDYEPCTTGSQCRNGNCDTGRCEPFCRISFDSGAECPDSPDPTNWVCAQASGAQSEPPHNACQMLCMTDVECTAPETCVWRAVVQGADVHHMVCAVPGPGRKTLGASCSGHTLAGDDECETGLCFGFACSRPCSGPGAFCGDVGAGATCVVQDLAYGTTIYPIAICTPGGM